MAYVVLLSEQSKVELAAIKKSGDFLRFYAYLCHVIDDFACLELQH